MSANGFAISIDDVREAARQIEGQVVRTPLIASPKLSALTGAEVFVKYENLQFTNSFKDRGALVKLLSLTPDERSRGVIAMSAGNHAQSVAYHAGRLQIPATIVMPEQTPFVKVGNTEALGAEVVLSGETLFESKIKVDEIASECGMTLVHPYDDPAVMAGQGTVALEVLEDEPGIEMLVIPVGGGGLIAGNAVAGKALKESLEIVGVEAALYPSMYNAVRGANLDIGGQTLAEGIAVKTPGELTMPIIRELVSDIVLVDEIQIECAVCNFLAIQKTMAEGAGAAGLAAMLAEPERFKDRKVCLYLCGGNIDPRILASIMIRGLGRERKIVSLRLTISDRPGVLGNIATTLGQAGANILEVSHRRMFLNVPAKGASLDVMIETRDAKHADKIIARLVQEGYAVEILDEQGSCETGTH